MDFKDKVAVVTGGASGIGLATVRRFASEGARVVVADKNADDGERAAKEVDGLFVAIDVGSPREWSSLIDTSTRELGGIDIAYLNAGVTTQQGDITELTDDQYRRIMGANIDGVVYGTRAVVPAIAARGGGAVVATASLAGLIAFAPDPIYTLTKHAVVGLVRSLAAQLQPKKITINAICPGIVDTPLVGDGRERIRAAGFPMLDPSDIAEAVVTAINSGESGQAWAVQPGRLEMFKFGEAPGPRIPGAEGMRPPGI